MMKLFISFFVVVVFMLSNFARSEQKVIIKTGKGEQLKCQKGPTKQHLSDYNDETCPFYSCKGKGNIKTLAFIPFDVIGSDPIILKLNGDKTEVLDSAFKIYGADSEVPLFDLPDFALDSSSVLDQWSKKYLIPSKYHNNITALEFLTNSEAERKFESASLSCASNSEVGNLLAERKVIASKMYSELATMKLSQYISVFDGSLVSLMVNSNLASELGCLHDGMIISNEAKNQLAHLEKLKPKPSEQYLSETEVQKIFQEVKAMSDIPFDYKYDGCYARAHIIAKRLKEKGIAVEKAWIKANIGVPGTDIQWNYHVAPAINIKDSNGKIQKYIIDPSLNSKAVPIEVWLESMGINAKKHVIKTGFPFPQNISVYKRAALSYSNAKVYWPEKDEDLTEIDAINDAMAVLKQYSDELKK